MSDEELETLPEVQPVEEQPVVEEVVNKPKKVKKPKSKARKIIEWVLTGFFLVLFVIVGIGQIDAMVHKKKNYGQTICYGYATFVVLTDSMEGWTYDEITGEKIKIVDGYKVDTAIITKRKNAGTLYKNFYKGLDVTETDTTKLPKLDVTFMDVYSGGVDLYDTETHKNQTYCTGKPMTHRVREIHYYPDVKYGQGQYKFVVSGINVNPSREEWKLDQYQVFTEKEMLGVVVYSSAFLGGCFKFVSSPWGLLVLLLIPALYLVVTSVLDIFKVLNEDEKAPASGPSKPSDEPVDSRLDKLSDADRERLKQEMLQEMMEKKKGAKKDE